MARRVGWDMSAFDGREKKKRTEWMNVTPELDVYFFLSFSLSLLFFFCFFFFFFICPFITNERAYLSVLFFLLFLLLLLFVSSPAAFRWMTYEEKRREKKMEMRFIFCHLFAPEPRGKMVFFSFFLILWMQWRMTLNIWFLIC